MNLYNDNFNGGVIGRSFEDIEKAERVAKAEKEKAENAADVALNYWNNLFNDLQRLREAYSESDIFWASKMGKLFAKYEGIEKMLEVTDTP